MFAGTADAAAEAEVVAAYFADYEEHQGSTHSGMDREQARSKGVRIEDLEASQDLQDAVLSVHHATMHTLKAQQSRSWRTTSAARSPRSPSNSSSRCP